MSSVPPADTTPDNGAAAEPGERTRLITPGRIVLAVIVALSFSVWGYAYSGLADRPAPDTLDIATFADRGEPICASTMDQLAALPNALDATDERERAAQLRQANGLLLQMVESLQAEVTGTERDVDISNEWLDDWRIYITDRADYADRLENDPAAVLYFSAIGGERLERRITRFANTNRMFSCATPTDVG